MTVTTDATAAQPETETEAKTVVPVEELNDLLKLVLKQVEDQHKEATTLIAKVNAASGEGIGQLLSELRENSDNPEVVKLRERVARAHEAINLATTQMDAILKPQLNVPDESEVASLKDELKALQKNIKTGREMFDMTAKSFNSEAKIDDYLEPLPGMRKASGKVTTEGLRRPRLTNVEVKVNGGDFETVGEDGKSTFTHLAMFFKSKGAKVAVADLHKAWTEQNGVSDFSELPSVTTFVYTIDGNAHEVRVTK